MHCVEIIPRGLTIAELEPNDCRFPYGDRDILFCGHSKQEKSSYCSYHHAICWEPARTNVRRAA